MVKLSKFCPESLHDTPIDVVVLKCRKILPTRNRWNRALFTGQKNIRLPLKLSLLRWSPKVTQGQPQKFGSQIGLLSAEL